MDAGLCDAVVIGEDVEEDLAVAVEFDLADAVEVGHIVEGGGSGFDHFHEGAVVEDDVRGDVLLTGEFQTFFAEQFEDGLLLGGVESD